MYVYAMCSNIFLYIRQWQTNKQVTFCICATRIFRILVQLYFKNKKKCYKKCNEKTRIGCALCLIPFQNNCLSLNMRKHTNDQ